jgi:hypothetical protein
MTEKLCAHTSFMLTSLQNRKCVNSLILKASVYSGMIFNSRFRYHKIPTQFLTDAVLIGSFQHTNEEIAAFGTRTLHCCANGKCHLGQG